MKPTLNNKSLKCFFNSGKSDSTRKASIEPNMAIPRVPINTAPAASCALGTNFLIRFLYSAVGRATVNNGVNGGLVDLADGVVPCDFVDVPVASPFNVPVPFGGFLTVRTTSLVEAEVVPEDDLLATVVSMFAVMISLFVNITAGGVLSDLIRWNKPEEFNSPTVAKEVCIAVDTTAGEPRIDVAETFNGRVVSVFPEVSFDELEEVIIAALFVDISSLAGK